MVILPTKCSIAEKITLRLAAYISRLSSILHETHPYITEKSVEELKDHYAACEDACAILPANSLSADAFLIHHTIAEGEGMAEYAR